MFMFFDDPVRTFFSYATMLSVAVVFIGAIYLTRPNQNKKWWHYLQDFYRRHFRRQS